MLVVSLRVGTMVMTKKFRSLMITGCLTMAVGETARLEIPWPYAYGEKGHPGFKIPGKADLIFEIQVLSAK